MTHIITRRGATVLRMRFRREAAGDVSHSNVAHVIDADGVVVHQQAGLHKAVPPTVAAVTAPLR